MLRELRPALSMIAIMTVLTGVAYPLTVTAIAQAVFPWQAQGSLIEQDGKVIGSALIGQAFSSPIYFWGRSSAAGAGYDAANSSGSNLGPTSKTLQDGVAARVAGVQTAHPEQKGAVPADMVTASGSGLDPHITPMAADWQVQRVADARHVPVDEVQQLVAEHTERRTFGVFGEPRVNVLKLNLALDQNLPIR